MARPKPEIMTTPEGAATAPSVKRVRVGDLRYWLLYTERSRPSLARSMTRKIKGSKPEPNGVLVLGMSQNMWSLRAISTNVHVKFPESMKRVPLADVGITALLSLEATNNKSIQHLSCSWLFLPCFSSSMNHRLGRKRYHVTVHNDAGDADDDEPLVLIRSGPVRPLTGSEI